MEDYYLIPNGNGIITDGDTYKCTKKTFEGEKRYVLCESSNGDAKCYNMTKEPQKDSIDLYCNEQIERKEILTKEKSKAQNAGHHIKIDGITFYPVCKYKYTGRQMIFVISSNGSDMIPLVFYSSCSQSSMLRLCVFNVSYKKGHDYTSSSFVHIDLQKYIISILDSLDVRDVFNVYCGTESKKEQKLHKEKKDAIDDERRYIEDPVFQPIVEIGINFLVIGGKNLKGFFFDDELTGKDKELADIAKSKINIPMTGKLNRRQIQLDIIKKLSGIISQYMANNFEHSGKNEFLYSYSSECDRFKFENSIYRTTITKKGTNEQFQILYNKYRRLDDNKTYGIILLVTPIHSKVNKYGLYDKCVAVGIYAYKALDYNKQLKYHGTNNMFEWINKNNIGYSYSFIGDVQNDMFPLGNPNVV